MKLGELFPELGGDLSGIDIVGVTADSRKVQPGYLFAAILGSRGDGRSFIDAALAAGAAAGAANRLKKLSAFQVGRAVVFATSPISFTR